MQVLIIGEYEQDIWPFCRLLERLLAILRGNSNRPKREP